MEVGTIHLMSFFAYAVDFKRLLRNSLNSRNNDARTNGRSIRLWMAAPPISSPDALPVIPILLIEDQCSDYRDDSTGQACGIFFRPGCGHTKEAQTAPKARNTIAR